MFPYARDVERYGHRIHAFCFMMNHIHLLIQVAAIPPLSKIMYNLAFRYSGDLITKTIIKARQIAELQA